MHVEKNRRSIASNSFTTNPYTVQERYPSQRCVYIIPGVTDTKEKKETTNVPIASSDSTRAYNKRNRTQESLVDINNFPDSFEKTVPCEQKTVNKYNRTNSSNVNLALIPSLPRVPSLSNSMYAYNNVGPTNSSYAYFDENGAPKRVLNPSASAYAYNYDKPHLRSVSPNPYARLPQYRSFTPPVLAPSVQNAFSDYAPSEFTVNASVPDLFSTGNDTSRRLAVSPIVPAKMTLNKQLFSTDSAYEINHLPVKFEQKLNIDNNKSAVPANSTMTVNRNLVTPESMYALNELPPIHSLSEYGQQVLRDYSIQSLEDLRAMPTFSKIENFNPGEAEQNVSTAILMPSNDQLAYFPDAIRNV